LDDPVHQRCNTIQVESQAHRAQRLRPRRRRSPGRARSPSLRCRAPAAVPQCGLILEPGVPAEAERAVDQGPVAADRDIGRRREPPSAALREALVVTCGYIRQNIIEEVLADISDVDQSTISRIMFLTPLEVLRQSWAGPPLSPLRRRAPGSDRSAPISSLACACRGAGAAGDSSR
jgi:hypothetical protein